MISQLERSQLPKQVLIHIVSNVSLCNLYNVGGLMANVIDYNLFGNPPTFDPLWKSSVDAQSCDPLKDQIMVT